MTQEELRESFKSLLDIKGYSYKQEGETIIIDSDYDLRHLKDVNYLPENVCFANGGFVDLEVKVLPKNTVFKNIGNIYLRELEKLSEGVRFENYNIQDHNYHLYCKYLEPLTIEGILPQKTINCYIKNIYG